jgi:hypothetical protein
MSSTIIIAFIDNNYHDSCHYPRPYGSTIINLSKEEAESDKAIKVMEEY